MKTGNEADVEKIVEAALFISGKPITLEELAKLAACKKEEVLDAINSLKTKYADSAIGIRHTSNHVYEMYVKEKYLKYVESLVPEKEFSPGTLKTLAYIAYKTPVKQSEVVKVRGNRAYEQIAELIKRGFVASKPKGHTRELRITRKLLRYFGLKNEAELKKYFQRINITEDNLKDDSN